MPAFGKASSKNLATAHLNLQWLFKEVVKHFDCAIICGYRNQADQDKAVDQGYSKNPWPASKHNAYPSLAVDVMPYPVDWSNDPKNIERITLFAGFVLGVASQMGIKIRWGGDWNMDTQVKDNVFDDFGHYELVG